MVRVFRGSDFWFESCRSGGCFVALSGWPVAERKSRRLPLLYGFTPRLKFHSVLFVSFCSKSVDPDLWIPHHIIIANSGSASDSARSFKYLAPGAPSTA
jgi:hypothetical protein